MTSSPSPLESLLPRTELFRGIGRETIQRVVEGARVRNFGPGDVLLDPTRPNAELFVLLEGLWHIHLNSRQDPPHRVAEPGDCLGELSLIDGGTPTAWVVADGTASVLAIPSELLWSLVDSSEGVARNLLRILSGRVRHGSKAIHEGIERQQRFEREASVDALTGLHNRRWLDEMFPRQVERCARERTPVSVLMVDVDRFKSVNDRLGHQAGDAVLASVGRALLNALRPQDLVARYGGEEFALVLPETPLETALGAAERVRAAVERLVIVGPDGNTIPPVTISIGLAGEAPGATHLELIAAADVALLQAKREGRNRCVIAAHAPDGTTSTPTPRTRSTGVSLDENAPRPKD